MNESIARWKNEAWEWYENARQPKIVDKSINASSSLQMLIDDLAISDDIKQYYLDIEHIGV